MFSFLQSQLASLTLLLKEKNDFLFHHYFSLQRVELLYNATNEAMCSSVGVWPATPLHATARSLCDVGQLGFLRRSCEEREGEARWGDVDESHCSPVMRGEMQRLVELAFEVAPVESAASRTDTASVDPEVVDRMMERMNCNDVVAMTQLLDRSDGRFSSVFKHCVVRERLLSVSFLSSQIPSTQWVRSFAEYGSLRRIRVLQDENVLRRAYEIVFSQQPLEKCDEKEYLSCNRNDVLPPLFCHFRVLSVQQREVESDMVI